MIVVVGAGPAGLAASVAASENGEKVLLIDSSHQLGGQYWRHSDSSNLDALGEEYLKEVQSAPNIEVLLGAQVWNVTSTGEQVTLRIIANGESRIVSTSSLILATGAYDRTLPFPGWDLPGVMTAGAAQALLKGSAVLAGKKIVVAGTGPFLLPVAEGLSAQGGEVVGLFDANRFSRWIPNWHVAFANPSKMALAWQYFRALKRQGVIQKRGVAVISAHAGVDNVLASVTVAKIDKNFSVIRGSERRIDCECLAVSWGFTADLSLAGNLGLEQRIGDDGGLRVLVDSQQQTSRRGVFAAGEITGIGGSELALVEGQIAGHSASENSTPRKRLLRERRGRTKFASALLKAHPVKSGWQNWLEKETIVCRCEEVSLSEIESAIANLGADNVRTVKLFSRVGMGSCQGRICGRSVSEIVAIKIGTPTDVKDLLSMDKRPIIIPILLEDLANCVDIEYEPDNQ